MATRKQSHVKAPAYVTKTIGLSNGATITVKRVLVNYAWNEGARDFIEVLPYASQRQIEAAVISRFPDYYKSKRK